MLMSMTAFSRQSHKDQWGMLVWEIKTVNHRYLELSLRLPEMLRQLESQVRDATKQQLARGKIDLSLKFIPGEKLPFDFELNNDLVDKLSRAAESIVEKFPSAKLNLMDVLAWQGVLQNKDMHLDQVADSALTALNGALTDIIAQRQREGEGLQRFIEQNLKQMLDEVAKVEKIIPEQMQQGREKILTRFEKLKLEIDPLRLEQELVLLLQKADVAEELQRLKAHIEEVRRVIKKGGNMGRRLDFLMQELNREANTLASKSSDTTLTRAAVELKVLIEQVREQVQNIE
ncbi:MAG: YicC family protein [Gammaproteobacteria bacterium]|nr:YicC family protein [Gammaproteobacteria bacterium]